jgi:hypothetical protein
VLPIRHDVLEPVHLRGDLLPEQQRVWQHLLHDSADVLERRVLSQCRRLRDNLRVPGGYGVRGRRVLPKPAGMWRRLLLGGPGLRPADQHMPSVLSSWTHPVRAGLLPGGSRVRRSRCRAVRLPAGNDAVSLRPMLPRRDRLHHRGHLPARHLRGRLLTPTELDFVPCVGTATAS